MSVECLSGNCSERTTCSSFSDLPCCAYTNACNDNDNNDAMVNMNNSFDSSCDDDSFITNDNDDNDNDNEYNTNNTLNIVNVIVNVIKTIITRSSSNNNNNTCNSAFYTESIPQISIHDYLLRIIKYTHIEQSTLICALIYIDRLSSSGIIINEHTVHKVLFTSILLSMKFNEDCIYNISFFAEIAGVPVKELLLMESEFVNKINFNCYVNEIMFNTYSSLIVVKP